MGSSENVRPPILHGTFSIAAYDPGTQSWGVATQSKYLAVGAVVPWARAGVGAVATQSRVNVAYGPASLDLLAQDQAPEAVLAQITAADPGRNWRQVGIVDRHGRTASYTGAKCIPWAGARAGEGYTCQGNMLASADVLAALAETFEHARDRGDDDFAGWLVAALAAAQAAGGDRRGQQSAALLVVRERGGPQRLNDRAIDLRVDDHPAPITALHRLLVLHRERAATRQPSRPPRYCTCWLAMQPTRRYPNTWTYRRGRLPRRSWTCCAYAPMSRQRRSARPNSHRSGEPYGAGNGPVPG